MIGRQLMHSWTQDVSIDVILYILSVTMKNASL